MSEHDEQKTLFDWIYLNRDHAPNEQVRKAMKLCYSVPNGASMKSTQRLRMWREGLTKGILDVNLDWPICSQGMPVCSNAILSTTIFNPGLRIEHKYRAKISAKIQALIDTGNYLVDLSPEQKEKRLLLIEAGYHVVVSYSAVQSIRTIFKYLPFRAEDYQGIKEYL